MDQQPSAPPLVAVVVASDPGPWLEDTLRGLGEQDYPSLSVLVIDAAADHDLTPRVASVLPTAFVRRLATDPGFGAAANEVLGAVEGAAFYSFHSDAAAPMPGALRLLVEESFRSNAGVVGPKLVEWERPEHLAALGLAVDKTGATAPLVEPGELDQEQHDAVRDVFGLPANGMVVRSDLFATVEGFDPAMGEEEAAVDLCWRAQLAGARVVVVPSAVVRYRSSPPDEDARRRAWRDRVRSLLKAYSPFHLLRVVPQALALTAARMVFALFGGRTADARALASSWWTNLRELRTLRRLRRAAQRVRSVPDREVRQLQMRGSADLRAWVGGGEDRARAVAESGRELVGSLVTGRGRVVAGVLVLTAVAVLMGFRHLVFGDLPPVGQLAPFPDSPLDFWRHYASGWRVSGLGSASPAPPAFALMGVAGLAFLGKMALLQKVLVLAAWPLAALGAWRLGRGLGSGRVRLITVIVYLAVPLPYDALARGRWPGLVAYAATPWLLARVLRLSDAEPFEGIAPRRGAEAQRGQEEGRPPGGALRGHGRWRQVVALGLALGLAAAFVPSMALGLVVGAAGLLLGSVLAGEPAPGARALAATLGAAAVAFVVLLPWSLDHLVPGASWSAVTGVGLAPDQGPGLGGLLRFGTGPVGGSPLAWAFLVAAALPLVIGRGWRLTWAVRLWGLALTCVGVAWALGRGWLPGGLAAIDVLLAQAALALAAATALGAEAFEVDLPGYRLGGRQVASVVAGAAVAVGLLPLLGASLDGRWHQPKEGIPEAVGSLSAQRAQGSFRVLWLGDPAAIPLDGARLADGVAYATSRDGPPTAIDMWPDDGGAQRLGDAVGLAQQGRTTRLGHLLAPMAVRYVVVPNRLAAGRSDAPRAVIPPQLGRALESQVDLAVLPSEPSVRVYENVAWGPARATLGPQPPPELASARGGVDLRGALPALRPTSSPVRFTGEVPERSRLVFSESRSGRWDLDVEGGDVRRIAAFGWANAYEIDTARDAPDDLPVPRRATLVFHTPLTRYLVVAAGLAVWVVALAYATGRLRRSPPRGPQHPPEATDVSEPQESEPMGSLGAPRADRSVSGE